MSSNNFEEEMLQSKDPEEALSPKANGSKRPRQRTQKPLKWQRLTPHVDLNKITDQLVVVRCLVQVQRKNSAEPCGHFLDSDNSTGNFIVHLATHRITEKIMREK
ncbi:54_t:CDS:2 [Funneliformis caledonium]|uniref:54_t:CDS:1 n=1 Tax=Funneliformis caledonium TaxID=1117310 RepID=A0A9N9I2F9_9GLOM|nr:54_t:CDS:2 [Funneliformis caledonium]